jgi:hypothetical protein
MPHVHRDLIIHWANGGRIEMYNSDTDTWHNAEYPTWVRSGLYREKSKPALSATAIELLVNFVLSTLRLGNYGAEHHAGDRYKHDRELLVEYIISLEQKVKALSVD